MYGMLAGTLFIEIFYPNFENPARFPTKQHQLLLTIGYFTRPFGALGFGHLGDTKGRIKALQAALLTLGLASALIGALPGHAQAGWAGWWALFALHAVQGVGVGGAWGGFLLLCYEYCSNDRHKGLFSALPQAGRALGYMVAALVTTILHTGPQERDPSQLAADAVAWDRSERWRLAHLPGLALPLVALYLHARVPEAPEWAAARRDGRLVRFPLCEVRRFGRLSRSVLWAMGPGGGWSPCPDRPPPDLTQINQPPPNPTPTSTPQVFRGQLWNILWALCALYLDGLAQVMVVGWGLPSLLRSKGVSTEALFSSLTIATAVQAPATLLGGWLGDRMGRRCVRAGVSMLLLIVLISNFPFPHPPTPTLHQHTHHSKLYCLASLALGLGTWPFFHAVFRATTATRLYPLYAANIAYLGVGYGILQGAFPALLVEIFPEAVRYSGASLVLLGTDDGWARTCTHRRSSASFSEATTNPS